MQEADRQKRASLAAELLLCLKDTCTQLEQTSARIANHSNSFFEEMFKANLHDIRAEIDMYNSNIEKVKQLGFKATAEINSWYDFIKDENQMKRLSYPVRLYFKRKGIAKCLKSINKSVSDIIIENRFIRERLSVWEQELKSKAIEQHYSGADCKSYELLLSQKDGIISELLYLLPTIPGVCPAEINYGSLDTLVETLSRN